MKPTEILVRYSDSPHQPALLKLCGPSCVDVDHANDGVEATTDKRRSTAAASADVLSKMWHLDHERIVLRHTTDRVRKRASKHRTGTPDKGSSSSRLTFAASGHRQGLG